MSGRYIYRFKNKGKNVTGRHVTGERKETSFRKPNPEFSRASFQVQDLRETLNKRYQEKANDYGKTHKAVNSVGVKSNPVDLIKHTMSKLYNLETRVMNLSNFQQAEQFIKQGIFIAINKAKEFRNVVNIIVQSSPDIVALNLSNNKLSILEPLQSLADKCSSLKALDLSKNNITSFDQINHICKLDLFELVLEGNPFVDNFPTRACYARALQKKFKNLKRLDYEDLPAEISFDLGVKTHLPQNKFASIPPECKSFVLEFLEAYYRLYDSADSRQALVQAYHDKAIFSFSYSKHDSAIGKGNQLACFADSHNLLRMRNESNWVKCVKTFGVEIVSFLCKFPATEHDPSSFNIDVPFYDNNLIIIVVNGIFKETHKEKQSMRSFCRTFNIISQGQGYVIVNDMFVISSLSEKQSVENKRKIDQAESNNPSSSVRSTKSLDACPDINLKDEIILRFMLMTNMNRAFSVNCLESNNYNPEAAFAVFQRLHGENKVPPEAFIK